MERRIITTEVTAEDERIETTLRPQHLKDYIGQERLKSTLKIYIDPGRGSGPRAVLRPSRPGQDHPGRNHCQ